MKLFFSLFFFLNCYGLNALEPIIINYLPEESEFAELIQVTLLEKLFIPPVLIKMKVTSKGCQDLENIIWQICFEDREMFFPNLEQSILEKSYQIFWSEE
jgi:hypothetical protein